jgi:hypothetical protein
MAPILKVLPLKMLRVAKNDQTNQKIQSMNNCPNCKSANIASAIFCEECGTNLTASIPSVATETKAQSIEDDLFWPKEISPITVDSSAQTAAPNPEPIEEKKAYCRHCGNSLAEGAFACMGCGLPPLKGRNNCQTCGATTHPEAIICIKCGVLLKTEADNTASITPPKNTPPNILKNALEKVSNATPAFSAAVTPNVTTQNTNNVIIIGNQKSLTVAILLTFFFGPLGLFYASPIGGIVMLLISLVGLIIWPLLLVPWIGSIIWAIIAVSSEKSNSQRQANSYR